MAQLGADDAQLERLAVTFDEAARQLTTVETAISSRVRAVHWVGPDADAFRGRWSGAIRSQLISVFDRLSALGRDLRAQAEAQRQASAADGVGVSTPPAGSGGWSDENAARHRIQLRDLADASEAAQRAWWDGLTDDQRAALLRNDPGALFGLEGLPADVRDQARDNYIDSVRSDLELSSREDRIAGELNVWYVHLGVEGSAAIVEQADGTFRVDLGLDGEIGASLGSKGAKGHAGIGAGVAQSYEFDSQAEAEAFVDGLYERLTPDVSVSMFAGPGAVMADTVDDVVNYLGDHSDQRTSFEGEVRVEGEVDLSVGAFDVNVSGEAGARYNFDSGETTLFVGGSASGSVDLPSAGAATTSSASVSADLEVQLVFDEHHNVSALSLSGTLGGEASVGVETFLNGTNADSATPETLSLSAAGGADVRFDASLDLQDPIVQRRAVELLNSMGNGGVSLDDLQGLLRESEVQVQIDATSSSSDEWDIGIASLEISETTSQNVVTWVKPAGGDFTHVSAAELSEERSGV